MEITVFLLQVPNIMYQLLVDVNIFSITPLSTHKIPDKDEK
jgi:hypothetical protein